MSVSVCIENLTKGFGAAPAVDDVSLTVDAGELFFLLGPSGCGKTTLLRCVAGFYEPDRGRIRIGDRDVTQIPPHQRDTGMVFQSYALWPHMSIRNNVAFGLQMRRLPPREIDARVTEALDMVKMSDRADDKPNQLSGGQQQRVALARALVVRPCCLLMDEPLSNLDAKLRLEMRAEIRFLCKEAGLTAIYVTHDQKEALSIADRLAVMEGGRIRQIGRPQDVYRRPNSRFVAGFIGETNFLPAERVAVANGRPRVRTAIGELLSDAWPSPEPRHGKALTVSLRPEVFRLGPPPEGAPNRIECRVRHTVYMGEMAQHELHIPLKEPRLAGAEPGGPARIVGDCIVLKAFELNPAFVAGEQPEAAQLWIDPRDVGVLDA